MSLKTALATLAAAGALAIIPAGANADVSVVVSPHPSSVEAPGGNVLFTVNVNGPAPLCVDCLSPGLETLVDSVYGDLNGKGTCAVSPSSPKPIPYVCTFTGAVNGAAGTTQIDTVTAGWFAIRTDPGHQPLRGTASASGAVSIIAAPALPAKKTCKKGFRLKTVKTKSGKKKKKCVRKKKGK